MRNPMRCLFQGGNVDAFVTECALLVSDLENREQLGFKDAEELTRSLGVCGMFDRFLRSGDLLNGRGRVAVETQARLMRVIQKRLGESGWLEARHVRQYLPQAVNLQGVPDDAEDNDETLEIFLTSDLMACAAAFIGEPELATNPTATVVWHLTTHGYMVTGLSGAAKRIMKQHNIDESDPAYHQWFLLSKTLDTGKHEKGTDR